MNGIERQAVFYRGYLIDERSLAPLTTALATIVGLWLLVYVFGALGGPEANRQMVQVASQASSCLASRPP